MYQTPQFSTNRVVGGTITTSGYADSGPMIRNLGSATDRVRNLNGRLGALLETLAKVEASLFGPAPQAVESKSVAPTPCGQIAELHESVDYAEDILTHVESVASRLHSI
jgi:hypothetical protein